MNIILLSGGSGTRLWPLSNETMSKQFLRLLRDDKGNKESMVQRVFRQIKETGIDANIVIATNSKQLDSIRNQLGNVDVVLEPERRNTYPAILLACAYLKYEKKIDKEESILVLPVDPYTENSYFETLIKMDEAIQNNAADMVLMGINPTYPSEKYGYIVCKKNENEVKEVERFQEKPDLEKAKQLLEEGAYWNAGVFGFKLKYIEKILGKEISNSCFDDVYKCYSDITKNSFDYEVVEKANSIAMVSYNGNWKDLGTWNTLSEEMSDTLGNVILGENSNNVSVINVTDRPVVALGLNDIVIAASAEGILVSNKDKSSYLRPYVENLNDRPMYQTKRWGEYRVIDEKIFDDGVKTLTKHLTIKAGKSISYQLHNKRDEIWTIVDGNGELIIDGEKRTVTRSDTVSIKKGQKHKITAITELHFIETQIGTELTEEDIEYFD